MHKPFNIKLSVEHRAKLEAYRASRGLRSEADAVRDLIVRTAVGHEQFTELLRAGTAVEEQIRTVATREIPLGPIQRKPGSMLKKR